MLETNLELPADLLKAGEAWAARSEVRYANSEKENTRLYGSLGIDKRSLGRMGECAACLVLGLDPMSELDWGPRSDRGHDLVFNGQRIDVKTTTLERPLLIWPVTKNALLMEAQIDTFILVGGSARPTLSVCGWIPKPAFMRLSRQAPPPDSLDPGTLFMRMDELIPMSNSTARPRSPHLPSGTESNSNSLAVNGHDRNSHWIEVASGAGRPHGISPYGTKRNSNR